MSLRTLLAIGLLVPGLMTGAAAHALRVTVNDLTFELPLLGLPVLPGAVLDLTVLAADHAPVSATLDNQPLPLAGGRGEILAPHTAGVHRLVLFSDTERTEINLLVMTPASRAVDGNIGSFRIDAYPDRPLGGLRVYAAPAGFIEVTEANRNTPVSPSYTLGEFVAKQAGGWPKYVVLRPRLLLKLEMIAAELRAAGHSLGKFTIMSGYRTPFYNRAIGNSRYSRHVWGGAADVYIDEAPRDGVMDDLDGDGRITRADARWLWDFVDAMSRSGRFGELRGGLGLYGASVSHGPFVHIDVRGFVARW